MKKLIFVLFIKVIALNVTFSQISNSLKWLEGSWKIETGKGTVIENWKIKNDSTVSGQSMFVAGKDTMPQEKIELAYRSGHWYYHPILEGQTESNSVKFKVIFSIGSEFISENPEHDFPQRISYRRVGDWVFASIEGKNGGKYLKENFDFFKN